MNASIEMKIQKLDEMIELRKQIIEAQEELGMDIGTYGFNTILVREQKELLGLADYLDKSIELGRETDGGRIEILFHYKGIMFNTFIAPEDVTLAMKRSNKKQEG